MSSERGNTRKGAAKHQNSYAFKHNPKSKKTDRILATPTQGLCDRCHQKIEWRKKYRKYKPLTAPRKCSNCQQKCVKHAYHEICGACAQSLNVCAKCKQQRPLIRSISSSEEMLKREQEEREKLARMTERQRRTYLRNKEKGKDSRETEGDEGSESESEGESEEEEDHKEVKEEEGEEEGEGEEEEEEEEEKEGEPDLFD